MCLFAQPTRSFTEKFTDEHLLNSVGDDPKKDVIESPVAVPVGSNI